MATGATKYSYAQLEQLWINAGGAKSLAPVAAAIAEAESGGRPDNNNYNDSNGQGGTQTSWGLWQISNGTHAQPVPNIDDPNVNARAAVAKYQAAGGWSPWGTYTSGAYRAFLSPGTTPDSTVPTASTTAVTTADQGSACIIILPGTSLFGSGICVLSKEAVRYLIGGGLMLAGGLLVLTGLVLVAMQSGPGRAVVQASPAGRVLKAPARRVDASVTSDARAARSARQAPAAGRHARSGETGA